MPQITGDKGFTLVELMVAIVIIGVLATVAIGEYMSYQAKAKQSEAKINIEAISKLAEAYKADSNTYAASIVRLGWSPNTYTRYRYWYNNTFEPGTPSQVFAGTDYSDPGSWAGDTGYSVFAVGNVDSDTARDIWSYTQARRFINNQNDVNTD